MAVETAKGREILSEEKKLKRELTLWPLAGLIFFTVCGGSFGIEGLVGWSGPGLALLLIFLTPIIYSIPNMLMVQEMTSMMPREGGYYHWIKQAFGPFWGFMAGWANWVVSWVDVSIYPVLATYYLSYFIPALNDGAVIGGVEVPAWVLSWIVSLILIWAISYLNIRGARLSGITTNWLGVIMFIPLILLTLVGIYSWIRSGATISMPFLPNGETFTGALSVGLFIVMWNYMGWELPTAAGDEIVNPKRTYPLAMLIVLVLAIANYTLPTIAGLYGGAGDDGRYQVWGIEEYEEGEGIGVVLEDYGVTQEQMADWGVDPMASTGWEFPDIGHRIGEKLAGENSPLALLLGSTVTFAAVLSMIGLFIGNGLGGTRIPFALAEDGMMPKFMVKVHPRYGTPWVAILFCGILFSIFSLNAFSFLVVVDVFLNVLVLLGCFLALWKLRFKLPSLARKKVPGGYLGLVLVTLGPTVIFLLAVYSQVVEEGMTSLGMALGALILGAILYIPIRRIVKPGVPDVNPFEAEPEAE
jgi:amino acid transporter